jgi:hypothetical protein
VPVVSFALPRDVHSRLTAPFLSLCKVAAPAANRVGAGAPARWPVLLVWLVSLLFWIAQAGAAAHALEHLHDDEHGHHDHVVTCELCLAYATVGGGLSGMPPGLVSPEPSVTPAARVVRPTFILRAERVRIRAPPSSSTPVH